MVPLLMLMACLEAAAQSQTISKTTNPPGSPSAGIIIIDQKTASETNIDVATCGIIVGDAADKAGLTVANSSNGLGRN